MTNMQSFTKIFIIEIKKETLEQVFSREFCEISKNGCFWSIILRPKVHTIQIIL